ncbi:MAG: hypothetical protein KF691_12400 [Phycisphaeraceae bacterium]|nr:hypothetical protein [Phycisphaeraceae bacterium]
MRNRAFAVLAYAAWSLCIPRASEAAPVQRTADRPDEFIGSVTIQPEGTFTTKLLSDPFEMGVPLECVLCRTDHPAEKVPLAPGFDPAHLVPTSPPTEANFFGNDFVDRAPNDINVWRNNTAFIGAPPLVPAANSITTNEPSLGQIKNVVFWTGNTYAAISRNGGVTWQYINPSTQFPAPPAADAGGVCCDQIVHYNRDLDIMVWVLQYNQNGAGTHNIQRLAVSTNISTALNNGAITWTLYRTAPEDFGIANTGFWLDYPDLAVSDGNLYQTTNVYTTAGNANSGAVIYRATWTDLTDGGGLTYQYLYRTTPGTLRPSQGSRVNMYWGTHVNNTTLRAWIWPDGGNMFSGDITHSGFQSSPLTMPPPGTHSDGTNFVQRGDNRVMCCYVLRDGVPNTFLGFMWMSNRGGGFTYPYTRVVGSTTSTININGTSAATKDDNIFNNNYCWVFPSAHPNSENNMGGTIYVGSAGAAGVNQPAAFVWKSDNGNIPASFENQGVAQSTNGPPAVGVGGLTNAWGDYFTTRRNYCEPKTWIGAVWDQTGAGVGAGTPHFLWWGYERDKPGADLTADEVVYVAPAPIRAGRPITLTGSTTNMGASTSGVYDVYYYLSTNTTYEPADILISSTLNRPALNAGSSANTVSASMIPNTTAPGTYYVLMVLDRFNADICVGKRVAVAAAQIIVRPPCPCDLNADDVVDDADFILFAAEYDKFTVPPASSAADFNNDGVVDDLDFVIFNSAYTAFLCP